ncbi:MAG TPA: zinc ribbon domain-containing protein [Candidatus Dormibacteraeota bacterium]|nr:zinc ribbon domain-containing protein [Candidatus Dormibacteraeota bacterium]
MPTYGYRCGACGHEFEIQQRISAEPLKVCPKCQGPLSKMLYPTGVIFKGSGFYKTDYKSASSSSSSNGSESSSSDSKSDTKSETKSEPKSDTKSEGKTEGKSDSKTEKAS